MAKKQTKQTKVIKAQAQDSKLSADQRKHADELDKALEMAHAELIKASKELSAIRLDADWAKTYYDRLVGLAQRAQRYRERLSLKLDKHAEREARQQARQARLKERKAKLLARLAEIDDKLED